MTKTPEKQPELFVPDRLSPKKPKLKTAPRGRNKPSASPGSGVVVHQAKAVAAPNDPASAKSMSILQIAKEASADPRVDAEKMRAIIGMAREEQNRLDEQAFERARLAVQDEIPPITKDSKNDHTKSKWARLEKISATADPIIRRHGFTMAYGMADCPLPDHYRVTCDVTHVPTGYKKHYFIDVGMDAEGAKGGGTKSKAQGSGSSITYARRYLKVMIFDINVVGEDFDGNRRQTAPVSAISPGDVLNIREKLEMVGLKETQFCTGFSIAKLEDLPSKDFDEACERILAWGSRNKETR